MVVDLNCQAILGMDILGDASKLPFILDLVEGTLSGGGYETIHRFQTATECYVETTDLVCIPPHSRADAEDWKIPILIYNSDPCTAKSADCTCNPVIIPGHTRIALMEEIQAIQHIGSHETERRAPTTSDRCVRRSD